MRSILINSAKVTKTSISAHTRNAIILSKELKIELVSTYEEVEKLDPNDYDKFIVVGSAFYPHTARIERWIRGNKSAVIYWINNEYGTSPNSEYATLMKRFKSVLVSNLVESANKCKGYDDFHMVNLNALMYNNPNKIIDKKYNCIYYGTYRRGRRLYLQEYLREDLVHLSSSKKNLKSIAQLCGTDAIYCDKLSWREGHESLNLFKYSLYIEDEFTHTNYNHPANRFYEAIMCNCVQLFDVNALGTFNEYGLKIPSEFIVSNFEEFKARMKSLNFNSSLKLQKEWAKRAAQDKKKALEQLKTILT